MITHRHVLRLFEVTESSFEPNSEDVWTLFHSYAFDFSVWEIWGALFYGGRLVIVPRETTRDPAAFLDLLAQERVTVLNQTPSAFGQLVQTENERSEPADLALRRVIFGGEAVDLESLRPWIARHGDEKPRLVNMYGITETTVHVTERRLRLADLDATGRNPIGRALADLDLHVVDAHLEPVPVGVAGEMLVGGAGPARGYLGRPGLTAERFVPDPWSEAPGARLYRSGDLARRRADGELEYLGRLDQQVQLRGFRVEPGEVQAALLAHPGVAQAAVIVRDDGMGARLVAYAVTQDGVSKSPAEDLRRHLEARLPEYMVPSAFVLLDALPLTANGKLDRKALPAPSDALGGRETPFVLPRNAVEARLAAIWQELLGVERVGAEDHFFHLGGHSLLATRLLARIRQEFGAAVELRRVFTAPRLAEMARQIEHSPAADGEAIPPLARPRGFVPLSPAQRRLWFLDRLEPGSATYNIPDLLELHGLLDHAALRRALHEIMARHEILRGHFRLEGEEPVQVVEEAPALPFVTVDFARLPAPEAAMTALERRESRRPFDLERGPLLRIVLLEPGRGTARHRDTARLLLNLHHIVSDGWSQDVLLDEITALYGDFAARRAPSLPAPALQYADWAAWQRRRLEEGQGEGLEAQLAWWRERLQGVPALELPTDRPRPASRRGLGSELRRPLADAEVRQRLESLARRRGVTLYMALLAAFEALLVRLAGQRDFAVGTPFAGRLRPEIQRTVGFFVNTLALRGALNVRGAAPWPRRFDELLERTRDTVLAAFERPEVPFERLVEEFGGPRGAVPPLCQVSFLAQPERRPRRAAGLEIVPREGSNGGAKFDLTLGFATSGDALLAGLEYDRELFDEVTAARFLGHFRVLLAAAAAAPGQNLAELPLVGAAERHQALVEWNDTAASPVLPAALPVHELVARQAGRTPTALAVDDGATPLDYATLVERARRLAGALQAHGVGLESRVGVFVERSSAMVVGMLAVLEAGAAYVPLDPAVPGERLAFQLADAGAVAALTSEALRPRLAEIAFEAPLVTVEEGRDAPLPASLPRAGLENLAYVIYTSGSTGRPKGTLLGHRGLWNLVDWNCRFFAYGPQDRASQLASPSFDAAVAEIWPPLVVGASLHVVPAAVAGAPVPLARHLAEHRVTIGFQPTPLAEALFEELASGLDVPLELRTLLVAGDRLHASPPPGLPFTVTNLYGPTEATVATSATVVRPGDPRTPSVGRPIAHFEVSILDRAARPLPLGAHGELAIAGPGLARGYHRQPGLTARKFIPHPHSEAPGARLYRSGDLARRRHDGALEFLGRVDHQVKIRGFRVELGEIETALREQDGVEEALVAAQSRPEAPASVRLVAWLTGTAGQDAARLEELRAALGRRLPDYMVPAVLVPLAELPRLPSGKIDRAALEREHLPSWHGGARHVAPRTPAEEVLAALWAGLLGLERVGRDDDFFALGGHSLLATRLASRIGEAFGVDLPLRRIFAVPRLADMAREIAALRQGTEKGTKEGTDARPALERLERPSAESWPAAGWAAGPASFSQERMWLLSQLGDGGSAYGSTSPLFLRGRLSVALLRRVFSALVRRHEALRTTFAARDGRPWQVIASPRGEHPLPLVDLAGLPAAPRQRELERSTRRERRRPIDFSRGPIFRTVLLRLEGDEHLLLVAHHHILYDGWSMAILVRELGALYEAFAEGRAADLPALAAQYPDWAAWQRRFLESEAFATELERLVALLEPARRARPLVPDRPRGSAKSRAAHLPFTVDPEVEDALRQLARTSGATLFMVLLAAFHVTLGRATGASASVVGTPIANRQHGASENLIGVFVNTLALAADLADEPSFQALLGRVREGALAAFEAQQVPFEKVLEACQANEGAKTAARPSLFQAFFAFQNVENAVLELPGLRLEPPPMEPGGGRAALFDLTLTMNERGGALAGQLEYDAALFDAATAKALLDLFERTLAAAAGRPERSIRELPWLEEDEERRWRERAAPPATPAAAGTATAEKESEEERAARLKAKVAGQRAKLSNAKKALLARRLKGKKAAAGAAASTTASTTAAKPRRDAIPRRPPGAPAPLSFAQERLWFLDRLEPGSATYNIPLPVRLRGPLEVSALARAFDELRRRHEILRSRYEAPDGIPRQVVEAPAPRPLPVVDLGALDSSEPLARQRLRAEVERGFDLERGPVIRTVLLRLAADDHMLACVVHHIAFDGWSVGLLIHELSQLYAALAAGRPSPLPELPVQYADYAAWQRQWLSGGELERQVEYWKERLGDAPPLLELPTDRPRPPVQTFHGEVAEQILDADLAAAARQYARQQSATLFVVLLAAFDVLLARLAGQDDVTVGTPIAGRAKAELEGLLGMFLNTLVLRVQVEPGASFDALTARVKETALGAYAHQDVPFEKLLEVLEPERDLSRTPLFQVFFNMLNLPPTAARRSELAIELVDSAHVEAKFDLTIYASDRPHDQHRGLALKWVYNADLFDGERVEEMLAQYEALLRQALANPELPLERLQLRGPARSRLPTPAEPLDAAWRGPVHEVFAALAREHPGRLALRDAARSWSYGELAEDAGHLAAALRGHGVERGEPVAVWAERRGELVVALLGILRASGAFLVLDPAYPAARHLACLELARPRILVKVASEEVPEELDGTITVLEALPSPSGRGVGGEGSPEVLSPEDLAYIAFTSGSTGIPKGILGRHGSLSHFIPWQRETFDFRPEDRYSLLSGLAHDPLHRDVFTPLQTGAAVIVPDAATFDSPPRLAAWLRDAGITVAHLTPAMAQVLTEGAGALEERIEAPDLRWAFLTGDALTQLDVERLRGLAPRVRAVNLYGSTETQRAVGFYEALGGNTSTARRGGAREVLPLGRGMRAVQLLVLDGAGRRAGVGEVGEIAVRSPHLSRGYLGLPTLTASRFVPQEGAAAAGERVYRTGDLGRYRPDGVVTFAGRADQQVQVRGYRVELPEIEGALRRHPAVREAAVLQISQGTGEAPLVAFLVPADPGTRPAAREIRAHLAPRLPFYMVPSAFLWLERLPLTPNRKLDRAALRRRAAAEEIETGDATLAPPRTPTEEIMLELWREVLGRERIGVMDGFFELGGHSLLATRLLARVHQAFGVELPLRQLFAAPTVAALATYVDESRGSASSSETRTVLVADRENLHEPFPLTEVQQAYWVGRGGGFELGGVATHSYQEFDLPASFDLDRLELAWRRLIARHDMLRAIVEPDGRQRILEEVPPFEIPRLDLRGRSPSEVEAALAQQRRELSHQVLDAGRWPLFDVRATLYERTDAEAAEEEGDRERIRLHLGRDLLIYDAYSGALVRRELALFYRDPEHPLPELEISFRDYVMAEVAAREGERYQRDLEYWRRRLDDLPPAPELPLAGDPARLGRPRFERRGGGLDPGSWSALRRHAARSGLTPSAVLLAAYASALGTWSKSPRLTLNLTLFNRLPLHPQIDRLVGDFTSLTLLAVELRPGESFVERARRLQERLWEDLEHRHVGGVWAQRELVRRRGGQGGGQGGGRGAVMPVVFTSTLGLAQDSEDDALMPADDGTKGPTSGAGSGAANGAANGAQVFAISQTPQVWLDHQVSEGRAGGLGFHWDSVAGLFPDGLVDAMFAAYRELLLALVDEETWERPLPLLTPPAQLEVLAAANATAGPVPARLLHEPFFARAAAQPDAVAVITPERVSTYGELARRSRQLARLLRRRGARPNALVAVLMEKGWEQAVAVFGVLAAGAAYLPIDPALPPERVDYLLENGDVEIVLGPSRRSDDERLDWIPVTDATLDAESPEPLEDNPARSTDLAYVIFTSGSTGQPKGVMIDHRGALNTCLDVNERFNVGPGDRMLGLSALNFDLSVYDLFGVLGAGAGLVLPRPEARRDPSHWDDLARRHRVTLWNTVPALVQMYVEYAASLAQPAPPGLRLFMMSGDWIPVTLPGRIRELWPKAEIISLGGATEASIWSIFYPVGDVDPAWTSIPYGRALRNQSFHVLDAALRPRPFFVPGELYIGGIGLARGYWKDQEKTAERFVVRENGERLYKTGDLGRLLPSGDIEFLGREDFQVKIQGHRIELGEIEAALTRHPAVAESAVLAVGERTRQRLVAWVALIDEATDGAKVDEEEWSRALTEHLASKLPAYMVPGVFRFAAGLPLTANGKIDRGALAARSEEGMATEEEQGYVEPRNEREKALAAVWAEVLDVERVGIHDNFFALGGDSVLGIRIVTRANEAGLALSPTALFEHHTVAALVASLDAREASSALVEMRGEIRGEMRGGARLPLFAVHAAGGNVFNYAVLAELLERPFYGLKARGYEDGETPRQSVEDMAEAYLAALRAARPEGPWALFGWSFGGFVAYEMACRLHEEGENVAFLGILDTGAGRPEEESPAERDVLIGLLANLGLASEDELARRSEEELRAATARHAERAWGLPAGSGAVAVRRFLAIYLQSGRAWRAYEPRPYAGRLTLFRARDGVAPGTVDAADPTLGWGALAAAVDVHEVPGDHATVLRRPRVEELARVLERVLEPFDRDE